MSNDFMINRSINVRMVEVGWFLSDRKNFVAFSKLLQDLPSKVYTSKLLKAFLHHYWASTQKKIIREQFLPYTVYATGCIIHYAKVLDDNGDLEDKLMFNIVLCSIIFPFWCHQIYNEYRQIKQVGIIN